MRKLRGMKILLALVSATWLAACGQTGPLRLPEKAPATEAAEPTQTTPSP